MDKSVPNRPAAAPGRDRDSIEAPNSSERFATTHQIENREIENRVNRHYHSGHYDADSACVESQVQGDFHVKLVGLDSTIVCSLLKPAD